MIIKEYRIPVPLDPEEYRIAQLYMIAKKSKLESEGEASGVEILTNEPYSSGPGGQGQYTDKIYHVEAHLPYWLRSFLPKSLASIREEAWNAYPYSKNRIYMPGTEKFSLDIESKYLLGDMNKENVFELSESELSNRIVDHIDFVSEDLSGRDYLEEEDPTKFVSKKTNRGPLTKDWLNEYNNNDVNNDDDSKTETCCQGNNNDDQQNIIVSNNNSNKNDMMCVYKICRVRFEQWGLQTRGEQFIQDYIRKTLVRAHRQAWAWQDEWHGLDMDKIREMEREVQESLAKLMRKEQQSA